MATRVRMAMVGCGYAARKHLHNILLQIDTTEVAVLCDRFPRCARGDRQRLRRSERCSASQ